MQNFKVNCLTQLGQQLGQRYLSPLPGAPLSLPFIHQSTTFITHTQLPISFLIMSQTFKPNSILHRHFLYFWIFLEGEKYELHQVLLQERFQCQGFHFKNSSTNCSGISRLAVVTRSEFKIPRNISWNQINQFKKLMVRVWGCSSRLQVDRFIGQTLETV